MKVKSYPKNKSERNKAYTSPGKYVMLNLWIDLAVEKLVTATSLP